MARKYLIKTYGCQMNYSDSERIERKLEELGLNMAIGEKDADLIIFNTCSIRQKAEDKVFGQMIKMKELKKKNKKLIIAYTGCMVRTSSHKKSNKKDKLIINLEDLDLVFKINDLPILPHLLAEIGDNFYKKALKKDKEYKNYFNIYPKYSSKFQAFVPIMTGCDKFCSYCIVPFTRGREQSRPMDEIIEECTKLVKEGCKEITLLGQNVNSYGLSNIDFNSGNFSLQERQKLGLRTKLKNPPFVQLLKNIDALKKIGLKRIRYTSSHPYDMSDDLIKAHKELETLCEHIHLPIQSGDNNVLKRMNRHYTVEHYLDLIKKIKKIIPEAGLTTDIIVGFSGESEKEFQNTVKIMKKIAWNMVYIARYSVRKGTVGNKMPDDIDGKEKARRWHILNEILRENSFNKHKALVGKKVNVLVEKLKKNILRGRSREFIDVEFFGDKKFLGKEVEVLITKAKEWLVEGEIIEGKDSVTTKQP